MTGLRPIQVTLSTLTGWRFGGWCRRSEASGYSLSQDQACPSLTCWLAVHGSVQWQGYDSGEGVVPDYGSVLCVWGKARVLWEPRCAGCGGRDQVWRLSSFHSEANHQKRTALAIFENVWWKRKYVVNDPCFRQWSRPSPPSPLR